jgi:hypothetical protein
MGMRILNVEEPERIHNLVGLMRRKAWDLDGDFAWDAPIDVGKPLLPLAQIDHMFPGLDDDERLALSQILGLIVAQIFSDAEQFLNTARDTLWPDFERLFAKHPVLLDLGTQFFDEERKHAEMFRRYITRWLEARGLEPARFFERQPRFSESWQHRVILRNAARGGLSFWWIVLLAEEESPLIYKYLEEAPDDIEPLYLRIHRKHFEEEARHATFAYTAMAYLADHMGGMERAIHRRGDVILSQLMQWSFMLQAFARERRELRTTPEHPWLDTVTQAMRRVQRLPLGHLFRVFFREPTLVGPFFNFRFHENMVEMARTRRLWSFPLPAVAARADSPVNGPS